MLFLFYFLTVADLIFLILGLHAEQCFRGISGKSKTFYVPEGDSLTLSCVVQHCKGNWTGNWKSKMLTDVTSGSAEERATHHFTRVKLSEKETQLNLIFVSVSQSDTGIYKCSVTWYDGSSDEGHWMHLNVTKGT